MVLAKAGWVGGPRQSGRQIALRALIVTATHCLAALAQTRELSPQWHRLRPGANPEPNARE